LPFLPFFLAAASPQAPAVAFWASAHTPVALAARLVALFAASEQFLNVFF
jgi:hypothetical protein